MGLFDSFKKVVSGASRTIVNIDRINLPVDNIVKDLTRAGNSIGSIKNAVGRVADTLLTGADGSFFRDTGFTTSRISESALDRNRFASFLDSSKYSTQVTPTGKIEGNQTTSGIQFPSELGEYYIGFTFMDYERPNIMEPAQVKNSLNVYLPIPGVLNELHNTSWREVQQNVLGSIANQLDATNGKSLGDLITPQNLAGLGYGAVNSISAALNKIPIINMANGDEILGIVNQTLGAIPNPNLSVLFEGPTLRDMQFAWRFHPESPSESATLRMVINEFRKRMLPNVKAFGNGPNILGYPQMVEVVLYPNDRYLYKMKKCVVTGINADYAPNGVPTFFKGTKAPTVIEFTVTLKEIEYFLSEDFGGQSDSLDDSAASAAQDFGF